MQLSSTDISYIVTEFQSLVGAKIDQIYAFTPKLFCFQLHLKGEPKKYIYVSIPTCIGQCDEKLKNPIITPFVTYLRKHIKSTFIKSISQPGFNRVLTIECEFKDKLYNLNIELFDKGNIVVTDQDNKIVNVLEQQKWATRSLLPNKQYELEKHEVPTFESFTQTEAISKLLAQSGLGGFYAKYICTQLKIDPQTPAKDISHVHINSELEKLFNQKLSPSLLENRPIPFSHSDAEKSDLSFSNLCIKDELIIKATKRITKADKERNKLQKIINSQQKQLDNIISSAKDLRETGELIKAQAHNVDIILKQYEAGEYKPLKENKKTKTITIELK